MNGQDDREIGDTVWLRPQTKVAPPECYRRLAAVLVSVDPWPFVIVRIFDRSDEGRELTLHRDNVAIRPPASTKTKGEGDGTNQSDEGRKIKPAFPPHKPLSGADEPMLF